MRPAGNPYRSLVLVCVNRRDDGTECCAAVGGEELFRAMKTAMRAADPTVRVTKTGCLGQCLSGATVVLMPDGIWLGGVTLDDVPAVVGHMTGGPTISSA